MSKKSDALGEKLVYEAGMSAKDRLPAGASRFRLQKLPARYAGFVMPLILSLMMTFIVSAIAIWKSIGFAPDFLSAWIGAWVASWIVAFPTLLFMLPLVRRLVGLIVALPNGRG